MRSFNRSEASRPSTPQVCPACASSALKTTGKHPDDSSYWRCEHCGEIWNAGRREDHRRGGAGRWR